MIHSFSNGNGWGWFSYVKDGNFVIGHSTPHEGGELYRGKYMGDDTPYLLAIKKDDFKQYNRIVKYFEDHKTEYTETYHRHKAANEWNHMQVRFLIRYMQKTKSALEAFEVLGQEAMGLINKQIEELERLNDCYKMEE